MHTAGTSTAIGMRSACHTPIDRCRIPAYSALSCGQNSGIPSNATSANVGRHPRFAAMHSAPPARCPSFNGASSGRAGRRRGIEAPSHSHNPSVDSSSEAAQGIE